MDLKNNLNGSDPGIDEDLNDKNFKNAFHIDLPNLYNIKKGNSVVSWLLSAREFLSASRLIDINVKKLSDKHQFLYDNKKKFPISWFAIDPNRMLKGMAVESVLKALWLDNGNMMLVLDKNDRERKKIDINRIPNSGDHNLIDYSNELGLEFNKDEKIYLEILTNHIIADGRDPIHKQVKITSRYGTKFLNEYEHIKNIFLKIFNDFGQDDQDINFEIEEIKKLL